MVITKISLGLGNQMFQYAGGRALALRKNKILKLDISFFDSKHNDDTTHQQQCLLNIFKANLPILKNTYVVKALNLISKSISLKPYYELIWEDNFKFHPEIVNCNSKIICLYALMQKEDYFKDFAEIIRDDFTFKTIDKENYNLGRDIKNSNSISLHIRRGDYVNHESLLPCPIDYFEKAIEYMDKMRPNHHYYIFSDDIDWVRNNLKINSYHSYISHNNAENSYKDMYLMSQCKNNIIANSSFSWWGAWLNNYKDKIVIAPDDWFPKRFVKGADMVPSDWIKL